MADTSIGVSSEVKQKLEAEKQPGETYDGLFLRLLGERNAWTEEEIRRLIRDEVGNLSQ